MLENIANFDYIIKHKFRYNLAESSSTNQSLSYKIDKMISKGASIIFKYFFKILAIDTNSTITIELISTVTCISYFGIKFI